MSDHEKFFRGIKGLKVEAMGQFTEESFTIEELYQAFKSRMIAEIEQDVENRLLDMLGASIDEEVE